MELIMTRTFNGAALDCYKPANESDGFLATREQIGRLLEYSEPRIAIGKIHDRHKERLDKFSGVTKLVTPGGEQETVMYNFKGFLEICRYSNQPKANAVIDFIWSIMDELYNKRMRLETGEPVTDIHALNARKAEVLQRLALQVDDTTNKFLINNEAFKLLTGQELTKPEKKTRTPREKKAKVYTALQLARYLKWPVDAIMFRCENLGLTKRPQNGYYEGDKWYFTETGRKRFLDYVNQKIMRIDGSMATYEDGHKHIIWEFHADEAGEI